MGWNYIIHMHQQFDKYDKNLFQYHRNSNVQIVLPHIYLKFLFLLNHRYLNHVNKTLGYYLHSTFLRDRFLSYLSNCWCIWIIRDITIYKTCLWLWFFKTELFFIKNKDYIYITFEFKDNKLPIKPVNKASQAYNLLYLF